MRSLEQETGIPAVAVVATRVALESREVALVRQMLMGGMLGEAPEESIVVVHAYIEGGFRDTAFLSPRFGLVQADDTGHLRALQAVSAVLVIARTERACVLATNAGLESEGNDEPVPYKDLVVCVRRERREYDDWRDALVPPPDERWEEQSTNSWDGATLLIVQYQRGRQVVTRAWMNPDATRAMDRDVPPTNQIEAFLRRVYRIQWTAFEELTAPPALD
jgi:hypothetical protein